jgi:hypothetical protein
MDNNIPQPRYKRIKSPQRRSVYIGARIGARTKHTLDVRSLIHRQSASAIIERAVEMAAQRGTEFGGAAEEGPTIKSAHNYATDTWSPEPWVRRLKLSTLAHQFLTPAENAFWRRIVNDKDRYWSAAAVPTLASADLAWMREYVTPHGLPDVQAIRQAWVDFVATSTGVFDRTEAALEVPESDDSEPDEP